MSAPIWHHDMMMALGISFSVGSILATLFGFVVVCMLFLRKQSDQQKLVVFVLVLDFIKAINMLWWTLYNQGTPSAMRLCSKSSACKFAGFVWMFTEICHALFSVMICWSLYCRYRNQDGLHFFGRQLRLSIGVVIAVLVSAVLAVIPALGSQPIAFGNYAWWVGIACRRGGGAFFFMMFPIIVSEIICAWTAIANARLIMNISGSAPIAVNKALKASVVRKMVIFPFAFCLSWMPVCIFHILFFARNLEVLSTGGLAISPFVVVFSTMSGMMDTALFFYVFRVWPKLRAHLGLAQKLPKTIEASTLGTKSVINDNDTGSNLA